MIKHLSSYEQGGFEMISRYCKPCTILLGRYFTITQFDSHIADNKRAGNVTCSGTFKAGTTGVGCPGFVSRYFGYTTKLVHIISA
jgi:hypothetical protein